MTLPAAFYLKLGGLCFCVGAAMEAFMIHTGFYRIVTEAEAAKWEEQREGREARAHALRQRMLQHYHARGAAPPAQLLPGGSDGGTG